MSVNKSDNVNRNFIAFFLLHKYNSQSNLISSFKLLCKAILNVCLLFSNVDFHHYHHYHHNHNNAVSSNFFCSEYPNFCYCYNHDVVLYCGKFCFKSIANCMLVRKIKHSKTKV